MSQYQQRIGADRRVHNRFEDSRASLVELGGNNNGIVLNISEGGMAILSTDELDLAAFQNLRFQAPEFEHWMEIAAEIAWISDSRKQAGIRFKGLTETARTQLRAGISIATVRTSRAKQAEQAGATIEAPQEVTGSDSIPASWVATDSVTSVASESEQLSNEANTNSFAEEIGEDEGLLPPEVRLAAPDSPSPEAQREIKTNEKVISPGESKPYPWMQSLNSPNTNSPDTKPQKTFPLVSGNARPSALTAQKSALSEMRFRHLLAKSGVKLPSYARDGSIRVSYGKWAAIAAIAIVASLLAFLVGWLLGDPARIKLPH
ncbi:MAG TPA: PilZ domain-containing protein [Methylomirabilota bacterium]|nr:PilZ domain-containing protein [Methylomirabilota bacterium]